MAEIDYLEMYKSAKRAAKAKKVTASAEHKSTLEPVKLSSYPNGVLFAQNFVDSTTANALLEYLQDSKTPWEALGGREVLILGGVPHPEGAIVEALPDCVKELAKRLKPHFGGVEPNQLLINRYFLGQGIDNHNDGPLYSPCAAIISLLGPAMLNFTPDCKSLPPSDECTPSSALEPAQLPPLPPLPPPPEPFSLFLPPNSLTLFSGAAYERCKHGISRSETDYVSESCLNRVECGLEVGQIVHRSGGASSSHHRGREGAEVSIDLAVSRTAMPEDSCILAGSSQELRLGAWEGGLHVRVSLTFRVLKHVRSSLEEFGPCSAEMRNEMVRRKSWWIRAISESI